MSYELENLIDEVIRMSEGIADEGGQIILETAPKVIADAIRQRWPWIGYPCIQFNGDYPEFKSYQIRSAHWYSPSNPDVCKNCGARRNER